MPLLGYSPVIILFWSNNKLRHVWKDGYSPFNDRESSGFNMLEFPGPHQGSPEYKEIIKS